MTVSKTELASKRKLAERKKRLARKISFRSKSLDAPRSKPETGNFFKNTPSLINLKDINLYVTKKMHNTIEKFEKFTPKYQKETKKMEKLEKEVLDGINIFEGLINFNDIVRYKLMVSMLKCGEYVEEDSEMIKNEDIFKIIQNLAKQNIFQNYRGAIAETAIPTLDEFGNIVSGSSISIVMNEHYRFEQYKKEKISHARVMIARALKELKIEENKPYAMLILAYERVFGFNICLLEHLINLISKHVFNPFSIYCAEDAQNISFIREQLSRFKNSVPTIMNTFFNTEPLKRQIYELSQIKEALSSEDLKCAVASLSRYAIERVRVPQTADRRLNQFPWLNSAEKHRETLDFLQFHIDQTIPKNFNERKFLAEAKIIFISAENVKTQCTQIVHNSQNPEQALIEALFSQNQYFYQQLQDFMPNGHIDPLIKAYYQHQSFLRILNIVKRRTHCLTLEDVQKGSAVSNAMIFSAIVSHPKIEYDSVYSAHSLMQHYKTLSKIQAKPLPISPSYIGTTFVCFEKHIFVSSVREAEVLIDPQYPFENSSCVRDGEQLSNVLYPTCTVGLMVNPETAILSVVFKSDDQIDKDDRLNIDVLTKDVLKPEIDWDCIKKNFIDPAYNKLEAIMEERIPVEINHPPLGRLENLKASLAEQHLIEPASSSDTEYEEDDEDTTQKECGRIEAIEDKVAIPAKRARYNYNSYYSAASHMIHIFGTTIFILILQPLFHVS